MIEELREPIIEELHEPMSDTMTMIFRTAS